MAIPVIRSEVIMDMFEGQKRTPGQIARETDNHVSTVFRWMGRGVRGVKLRSFLVGGKRYIYLADFNDFLRELNNHRYPEKVSTSNRAATATRRLDAHGVSKPVINHASPSSSKKQEPSN